MLSSSAPKRSCRSLLAIAVSGVLSGVWSCHEEPQQPPPPPAQQAPQQQPAAAPPQKRAPLSQSELPTNDGALAVSNLESQIAAREEVLKKRPGMTAHLGALVSLLSTRGEYLGRLADYDWALGLADQVVHADPKDADSYLTRAGIRATLHLFSEALSDLQMAAKLGAKPDAVDAARASILLATGHGEEAIAIHQRQVQAYASFAHLGSAAQALAGVGEVAQADELFTEAQYKYHDVSPFAVAWLYFQHGLLWENEGRLGRAREFYEEAHARLPAYAPLAAHLAAVWSRTNDRDKAVALLRTLVKDSDDPEYAGQLCGLLREGAAADKTEADKLCQQAHTRFDDLLARHPQAFASHAARFFLGPGGDAKRALDLAKQNLKLSPGPDGYDLAVEAALSAGPPALACELAAQAEKHVPRWHEKADPPPFVHLHVLASKAYTACGQADRAAQELQAISSPGPAPAPAPTPARP